MSANEVGRFRPCGISSIFSALVFVSLENAVGSMTASFLKLEFKDSARRILKRSNRFIDLSSKPNELLKIEATESLEFLSSGLFRRFKSSAPSDAFRIVAFVFKLLLEVLDPKSHLETLRGSIVSKHNGKRRSNYTFEVCWKDLSC